MQCTECGAPAVEGAHFCGQCGARLDAAASPAPASPVADTALAMEGEGNTPAAGGTVATPAASGGQKTAPMTRAPELADGNAAGVITTRPMPAVRGIEPAPSLPPARRSRSTLIWILAMLAGLSAAALVLSTAQGRRWWQQLTGTSPDSPLAWAPPDSSDPGPVQIEPLPLEPKAPSPPAAPESSAPPPEPSPATPSPGERKSPAPAPAPPAPATPAPTPAPALPTLPPLAIPPGTLPAPWASASANACASCLEQLRGGGHYSVVMAVAQSLLCEDKAARDACETAIEEAAPGLAERAARAGDCPAAWATMAAALNLGVPADRFRAVDQACPR